MSDKCSKWNYKGVQGNSADQVLYAALAYETRAEVIGEPTYLKAVVTLGTRNF